MPEPAQIPEVKEESVSSLVENSDDASNAGEESKADFTNAFETEEEIAYSSNSASDIEESKELSEDTSNTEEESTELSASDHMLLMEKE